MNDLTADWARTAHCATIDRREWANAAAAAVAVAYRMDIGNTRDFGLTEKSISKGHWFLYIEWNDDFWQEQIDIWFFCCCCFVHFSWSWPLNTSRVWIVHLWPGCDAATFNEIPLTCGVECTPHRIKCEHFIMRRRTIRRRYPIHIRWTEWHLAGWLAGRWSVVVVMAALRAKKNRVI